MIPDAGAAVLFSCTLNSVRSPIAEALMKHLTGTQYYVDSAGLRRAVGTEDKPRAHPMAVQIVEELSLDLSRHKAKTFDDLRGESFDLIITLSKEAFERAQEISRLNACEVEYWPVDDPLLAEGNQTSRLAAFRALRDDLEARIKARFALTATG
ncbi:MAG: arsenate reductase ArsC [Alphaproteobacteria bacterium]|nr:arsenate reductase ArsC [Alphaproteobacteria bacterium SS10]